MGGRVPVLVVALLVVACGDGGGGTPGVTPTGQPSATLPAPTPTVAPNGTVAAQPGRSAPRSELAVDPDRVIKVPQFQDGLAWGPIAALGEGVLLQSASLETIGGQGCGVFRPV